MLCMAPVHDICAGAFFVLIKHYLIFIFNKVLIIFEKKRLSYDKRRYYKRVKSVF